MKFKLINVNRLQGKSDNQIKNKIFGLKKLLKGNVIMEEDPKLVKEVSDKYYFKKVTYNGTIYIKTEDFFVMACYLTVQWEQSNGRCLELTFQQKTLTEKFSQFFCDYSIYDNMFGFGF